MEDNNRGVTIVRNLDMHRSLTDSLKRSVIGSRNRLGLDEHEVGECLVLGACYNLFLGVPRTIKDIPRGNW